jgi:hypothetical protein
MLIEQVSKAIADNAKSNQWLSCHFELEHNGQAYKLGVKAFGRWIQRMELCGIVSNVPEQKTNKRLVELCNAEILVLLRSIGATA